jgi:methylenetetrahydrofolate dehydrogenase (NADP+)/methenyltetrahydrofolate cyclohydrolase
MELINGRKIAQEILTQVQKEVETLPFRPLFCDVLVGDDAVSEQYVRMKEKRAERVGIGVHKARFPENITTESLIQEIKKLNQVQDMCGLIVQLPLPKHIDTQAVLDVIDPQLDVDVLGQETSDLFYNNQPTCSFPTARAVMHILETMHINLLDKKIVMVGQGQLVGRPVTHLLEQKGCDVSTIVRETESPEVIMQSADVIISAVGVDGLITAEKIKEGVVLIDAGTSESDGGIVGDVNLDSVAEKASLVSGVPGGVGPVTVAMLLDNVVKVAKNKQNKD